MKITNGKKYFQHFVVHFIHSFVRSLQWLRYVYHSVSCQLLVVTPIKFNVFFRSPQLLLTTTIFLYYCLRSVIVWRWRRRTFSKETRQNDYYYSFLIFTVILCVRSSSPFLFLLFHLPNLPSLCHCSSIILCGERFFFVRSFIDNMTKTTTRLWRRHNALRGSKFFVLVRCARTTTITINKNGKRESNKA